MGFLLDLGFGSYKRGRVRFSFLAPTYRAGAWLVGRGSYIALHCGCGCERVWCLVMVCDDASVFVCVGWWGLKAQGGS